MKKLIIVAGNVIFCWVLHEQEMLDDLIASLDHSSCTMHCFSLVSDKRALSERLGRDIARGKPEPDIIERRAMERTMVF